MTTQTRFTPGPWEWVNRDSGSVMLQTPDRGRLVVMAFARKGMRLAEPRFAIMDDDQPRGRRGGILRSMSELIACGQTELPPDAALIEASPDLYAALEAIVMAGTSRVFDERYLSAGLVALKRARGEG